ncbi:MAG: alpha/beta fold hydrolase [Betaproteobacteria bacterium]
MVITQSPQNQPPRYRAPWWLGRGGFGAHWQTVYPFVFHRPPGPVYLRERWDSTPHGKPDGDFVDIDRVAGPADKPMVVVFHGLEGSSQSIYSLNLMNEVARRGWRGMVPHFRGCSGEINRLPRAYHSGDAAEIDWILRRAKAEAPDQPLYVAAISLGGNATLKWLGEQGAAARDIATAAASISAPMDLRAAGDKLAQGFCRLYTYRFLKTMKASSLEKLRRHPGIFREDVMQRARNLREFDNEVTAPLHGYRDTDDYWTRASAKPGLINVKVPTLVLNAKNDPFLPASALPRADEVSPQVLLDFPEHGGHVGFVDGTAGKRAGGSWLAQRVFHFFDHGN